MQRQKSETDASHTSRKTADHGPSKRDSSGNRQEPVAAVQQAVGNQAVQSAAIPDRSAATRQIFQESNVTGKHSTRSDRQDRSLKEGQVSVSTAGLCSECVQRYREGKPLDCPECAKSLAKARTSATPGATSQKSVQPKLVVSESDDAAEREADQIAKHVLQTLTSSDTAQAHESESDHRIQRRCDTCVDDLPAGVTSDHPGGVTATQQRNPAGEIRTPLPRRGHTSESISRSQQSVPHRLQNGDDRGMATEVGAGPAPPIVYQVTQSPGRQLNPSTRESMATRFGDEFHNVRVHTGAKAARSARAVNARAYTVGAHIVFGHGEYEPGTARGQQLLAHELTHVLQQRSDSVARKTVQRWSVTGATATVDSQSDTLGALAKQVGTSFWDWKCIKPVRMQIAESGNTPSDFDSTYERYIQPGDEFDISNLTTTAKSSQYLGIHLFDHSLDADLARRMYGCQKVSSGGVDYDIAQASGKGSSPIGQMTLFGHSVGNELYGGAGSFTPANYDSETYSVGGSEPSYALAQSEMFPRRCWLSTDASVRAVGCDSDKFGNDFASTYVRNEGSVTATTESVHSRCVGDAQLPYRDECFWYNAVEFQDSTGNTVAGPFTNLPDFHNAQYWTTIPGAVE